MMDIERLRAKSEKPRSGPKFDIRAFHDTVLSMGSVPLPVLDQPHRRLHRLGRRRYGDQAEELSFRFRPPR